MAKGVYHPNAYLSRIRNIKRGLKARSTILNSLEKGSATAPAVANESGMHYAAVVHHLKLLKNEQIIERQGNSVPHRWSLTGKGQKRL